MYGETIVLDFIQLQDDSPANFSVKREAPSLKPPPPGYVNLLGWNPDCNPFQVHRCCMDLTVPDAISDSKPEYVRKKSLSRIRIRNDVDI
jgi:hypothetical protein